MYFVICNSDGDTRIDMLDGDELERRLNEHYYGERVQFLKAIPDPDTNYWPENTILIIRGNIVMPQPQEIVTRYAL
jgi:hypothetical protein